MPEIRGLPQFDATVSVYLAPPDQLNHDDRARHKRFIPETDLNIVPRFYAESCRAEGIIIPNLFVYDTLPSPVNAKALAEGKRIWGEELSAFTGQHPVYLVVVGGRVDGNWELALEEAKVLAGQVKEAMRKTGGSLLFTTSRRTSPAEQIIEAFTDSLKELNVPGYYYDYKMNPDQNPYFGLLAVADKIVVPHNSMSMIADALATDAEVYVAEEAPATRSTGKSGHSEYVQNLLDQKRLKPISELAEPLPKVKRKPINTAEDIAQAVRGILAKKQGMIHRHCERSEAIQPIHVTCCRAGLPRRPSASSQ